MSENRNFSAEEEVGRIRARHLEALGAGMSNAEASAYANNPDSTKLPAVAPAQVELPAAPPPAFNGSGINSACSELVTTPAPPSPCYRGLMSFRNTPPAPALLMSMSALVMASYFLPLAS